MTCGHRIVAVDVYEHLQSAEWPIVICIGGFGYRHYFTRSRARSRLISITWSNSRLPSTYYGAKSEYIYYYEHQGGVIVPLK